MGRACKYKVQENTILALFNVGHDIALLCAALQVYVDITGNFLGADETCILEVSFCHFVFFVGRRACWTFKVSFARSNKRIKGSEHTKTVLHNDECLHLTLLP